MYDFVDRPVSTLDYGGRLLVWSMRRWVQSLGEGKCPAAAVAPAFAGSKVIAALQPFHRTMLTFNAHGLETFRFCSVGCKHISEHEAIILSLVCALHDSNPKDVRDTLALLIDEDSIGDMLVALSTLARHLDSAAIFPARKAWGPPANS